MDYNRACKYKLNSTGSFCLRIHLLICFWNTNIIPKVKVTAFHMNQCTEILKVLLNVVSCKPRWVTVMKV